MDNYCIKSDYISRLDNEPTLERNQKDQCQNEVYEAAHNLSVVNKLNSVLDVGTGSGFKLMKYFSDYKTLGLDLPVHMGLLNKNYPDRAWKVHPLNEPITGYDLVICSDVVEHMVDPNELMEFLASCQSKFLVISTPDRNKLPFPSGPPRSTCHCREWTGPEFKNYVSRWFKIIEQVLPKPGFSTQYIVCK